MNTDSPATVVKVLDHFKIVINRGLESNVREGNRFLVYQLSEEDIVDPETQKNLGKLEMVKGTGVVIHVQDNMAIIESDRELPRTKTTRKKAPVVGSFLFGVPSEEIIEEEASPTFIPFENPAVGDKAKRVR